MGATTVELDGVGVDPSGSLVVTPIETFTTYTLIATGDGGIVSSSVEILALDLTLDNEGDGIVDSWEWQYFGHISHDAYADPDGDGFSNIMEYKGGSDPTDPGSRPQVQTSTTYEYDAKGRLIKIIRGSGP
jgi:hypothetical protein